MIQDMQTLNFEEVTIEAGLAAEAWIDGITEAGTWIIN